MELKDFIRQTIVEIADGINEGHKYVKEKHKGEGVKNEYRTIAFDIAVTSNEEEKTDKGAKVSIANVFGVGANNENKSKSENVSRIKFDLHMHINTQNR